MSTLLAVYSSDGCEGRCDAKCYGAHGGRCECICRGANHGVGRQQAETNVREYAAAWLADWQAAHPAAGPAEGVAQLGLWADAGSAADAADMTAVVSYGVD